MVMTAKVKSSQGSRLRIFDPFACFRDANDGRSGSHYLINVNLVQQLDNARIGQITVVKNWCWDGIPRNQPLG